MLIRFYFKAEVFVLWCFCIMFYSKLQLCMAFPCSVFHSIPHHPTVGGSAVNQHSLCVAVATQKRQLCCGADFCLQSNLQVRSIQELTLDIVLNKFVKGF